MVAAAATAATVVVLHGLVTLGPTSPVCRSDSPCTKPAAHVVLIFSRQHSVAMATTDAHGRYEVHLAAGTWTVAANTGVGARPGRIIVHAVRSEQRNIALDTGIR